MEKLKSFSGRIDRTFGLLLMCQNLLEKIIPDSDNQQAREMAARLVAQLIKSATDELIPPFSEPTIPTAAIWDRSHYGLARNRLGEDAIIDSLDIDMQIERHLKSIIASEGHVSKNDTGGTRPLAP